MVPSQVRHLLRWTAQDWQIQQICQSFFFCKRTALLIDKLFFIFGRNLFLHYFTSGKRFYKRTFLNQEFIQLACRIPFQVCSFVQVRSEQRLGEYRKKFFFLFTGSRFLQGANPSYHFYRKVNPIMHLSQNISGTSFADLRNKGPQESLYPKKSSDRTSSLLMNEPL